MNNLKKIIFFGILITILSCSNDKKVDVSHIKMNEVKIKRLDIDFFKIDTSNLINGVQDLANQYNDFFNPYFNNIVALGQVGNLATYQNIPSFISDKIISEVKDSVENYYQSVKDIESELTLAFKYLKYYFPKQNIPEIVSYISGFNQKLAVTENTIAFSIDQYLGANCTFYKKMSESQFLRNSKNKGNIVPDILKALVMTNFDYKIEGNTVLSSMIEKAKVLYFLGKLLPDYPQYYLMGYTPTEIEICKKNESDIWEIIVENKLLFKSDLLSIKQLTDPAPFSNGISRNAPGRTMNWIGWQILKAYERESGLSFQQVMLEKNATKILRESMYKP
jgi:hypothetical protein